MQALMMRLALVCAAITIGVAAHAAGDNKALRKTLMAKYNAFTAAFQAKDIDKVSAMMTDDYTATQGAQTFTRDQIVTDFKGRMAASSNVKWPRTIKSLTVAGNNAIVVVDGHFTGTMTDPKNTKHDFEFTATSKDTWTKTPQGWKMRSSVVKNAVMKMDGKPFNGH